MSESLVSIIVPCFNQAEFLSEALTSVYEQKYEHWECLIIDDGSTDNTREISKKWIQRESRFKYFHQKNQGLSSARNFGLENATGSYIQFLDADDFLDKRKLSVSLKLFEKNEQIEIIITDYLLFDQLSQDFQNPHYPIKEENLNIEGVLFKWDDNFAIPIHCGLFSSALFRDFRFLENLEAKEDWVMWVKFFKKRVPILYRSEHLVFYRRHTNNMTNYRNMTSDIMAALNYIKPELTKMEYSKLLEIKLRNTLNTNFSLRFQNRELKQNLGFRIYNKVFKYFKL